MSPHKSILRIAGAVLAVGFAAGIASAEAPQIKTISVSLDQLDHANPAEVDALLIRLERAAKRACAVTGRTWTMTERMEVHECMDEAIEQAITSIDSPLVSAALRDARSR
ncbi:MAG: UrcA family protein [Hyphomonas sp.]|nr:UrcA family protein [Hyphomonas sp.]